MNIKKNIYLFKILFFLIDHIIILYLKIINIYPYTKLLIFISIQRYLILILN